MDDTFYESKGVTICAKLCTTEANNHGSTKQLKATRGNTKTTE